MQYSDALSFEKPLDALSTKSTVDDEAGHVTGRSIVTAGLPHVSNYAYESNTRREPMMGRIRDEPSEERGRVAQQSGGGRGKKGGRGGIPMGITPSPSLSQSPWHFLEFAVKGSLQYRMLFCQHAAAAPSLPDSKHPTPTPMDSLTLDSQIMSSGSNPPAAPSFSHTPFLSPARSSSSSSWAVSLISPWHDIPLYTPSGQLHCLCVCPRRSTWLKLELAKEEPFTPLRVARQWKKRVQRSSAQKASAGKKSLAEGKSNSPSSDFVAQVLLGSKPPFSVHTTHRAEPNRGPDRVVRDPVSGKLFVRSEEKAGEDRENGRVVLEAIEPSSLSSLFLPPSPTAVTSLPLPVHFISESPFNVGILPQTLLAKSGEENEFIPGIPYDDDVIQVIDIGQRRSFVGEVYPVKALGAFALIESGNDDMTFSSAGVPKLSWKILAVSLNDPLASCLDDVADAYRAKPTLIEAVKGWLLKCEDQGGVFGASRSLAFDRAQSQDVSLSVILEAHLKWHAMRNSSPVGSGSGNVPFSKKGNEFSNVSITEPWHFPPSLSPADKLFNVSGACVEYLEYSTFRSLKGLQESNYERVSHFLYRIRLHRRSIINKEKWDEGGEGERDDGGGIGEGESSKDVEVLQSNNLERILSYLWRPLTRFALYPFSLISTTEDAAVGEGERGEVGGGREEEGEEGVDEQRDDSRLTEEEVGGDEVLGSSKKKMKKRDMLFTVSPFPPLPLPPPRVSTHPSSSLPPASLSRSFSRSSSTPLRSSSPSLSSSPAGSPRPSTFSVPEARTKGEDRRERATKREGKVAGEEGEGRGKMYPDGLSPSNQNGIALGISALRSPRKDAAQDSSARLTRERESSSQQQRRRERSPSPYQGPAIFPETNGSPSLPPFSSFFLSAPPLSQISSTGFFFLSNVVESEGGERSSGQRAEGGEKRREGRKEERHAGGQFPPHLPSPRGASREGEAETRGASKPSREMVALHLGPGAFTSTAETLGGRRGGGRGEGGKQRSPSPSLSSSPSRSREKGRAVARESSARWRESRERLLKLLQGEEGWSERDRENTRESVAATRGASGGTRTVREEWEEDGERECLRDQGGYEGGFKETKRGVELIRVEPFAPALIAMGGPEIHPLDKLNATDAAFSFSQEEFVPLSLSSPPYSSSASCETEGVGDRRGGEKGGRDGMGGERRNGISEESEGEGIVTARPLDSAMVAGGRQEREREGEAARGERRVGGGGRVDRGEHPHRSSSQGSKSGNNPPSVSSNSIRAHPHSRVQQANYPPSRHSYHFPIASSSPSLHPPSPPLATKHKVRFLEEVEVFPISPRKGKI